MAAWMGDSSNVTSSDDNENESFHSPSLGANETDYGLEFSQYEVPKKTSTKYSMSLVKDVTETPKSRKSKVPADRNTKTSKTSDSEAKTRNKSLTAVEDDLEVDQSASSSHSNGHEDDTEDSVPSQTESHQPSAPSSSKVRQSLPQVIARKTMQTSEKNMSALEAMHKRKQDKPKKKTTNKPRKMLKEMIKLQSSTGKEHFLFLD